MTMLRDITLSVIITLIIGIALCGALLGQDISGGIDVVEMNNISKLAQKHWDNIEQLNKYAYKKSFYILDNNNKLIFNYGENEILTLERAMKNGYSYVNIKERDKLLGVAIIDIKYKDAIAQLKLRLMYIIMTMLIIVAAMLITVNIYYYNTVLKPFEKLKRFANSVACGNLDLPLTMDRRNVFGAFTESFDILREQLKIAGEKEYQANKSKKELVASLSHDIKTPVTTIKLTSELLIAIVSDQKISAKLHTIYNKAEQIDVLVTDLFNSTLEELGELKIAVKEEYSSVLTQYISRADYNDKATADAPPECMISVDPTRMEQIIGNIITNSYKYADTNIDVSFAINGECLEMTIKDYGKGVSEDELPLIFNKFYRSKEESVQSKSGVGLGLYISRLCMEKMGGDVTAKNEPDGFAIKLMIPLA